MITKYSVLFSCLLVLSACGSSGSGGTPAPNPVVNAAPVADAGLDATIRLPSDTATLDGTVTDDGLPAGAALSTSWTVQSGPAGATFADVNAVDTTVTFVSEGTYVLELTADDTALQSSDTVTIVVEAAPAVAEVSVAPADVSLLTGGTQLFSASGLDQYGDAIAVNVTWSATGGTIDQAGNYTAGGVIGAFVVTATDGAVSGDANVMISDSPPTADAGGPYMGAEGTPVALDGSNSSDPNNDIVAYDWDLDNDGAFDDASGVTTTFGAGSSGVFTIGLRVTDGDGAMDSDSTTVTVANLAPTANAQTVSTSEDTPLPITLTGSDPGSDPLSFAIGTGPSNGTLSGTAPNVTYTPNANYSGPDSFTFTVDDGEFTSAEAMVSITVGVVNDPPTADDQSVSTDEDTPLAITLTGSDPEMDPLTYAIGTGPSNGTLSGTAPDVTYTPDADYNGPDSFTFTVDDGEFTSTEATISITVNAINDAPIADDQSVSTDEDTPVAITLTGSDAEMDPLTYAIGTGPSNGTLSGTAPDVTYTPNADYNGPDSFTFTVDDGEFTSAEATVSITVNTINDPPTADDQSVSTDEDTPLAITLTGSDPEMDPLTYAIGTGPSNGTLSGTAPDVTYTPNADYNGPDSFTFTVDDGEFTSAEATVSITVNTINDPPTADDQSVSTDEDTPLAITLTGSDPEMDPLTYAIGTGPSNGTLSGTAPDVTYTPNTNYSGPDSFTFTVDDGEFTSAEATVSITVNNTAAPSAPTSLGATAGNGEVSLDWADNTEPDLAGYRVYRSETQGGPYGPAISGLLTASDYVDTTAVNGTTYYYVVTAEDSVPNVSPVSAEVMATPIGAVHAYWTLDENTGTTTADTVLPDDGSGTIVGANWTSGVSGSALDFNGSGDHVAIDNTPALSITGTEITLVAWINPRDGGVNIGSRVISKRTDAGGSEVYAMFTDRYRLTFRVDGQDLVSSHIIRLDDWTHVAMVYDGADMRIYVNGVLDVATPLVKSDPIDESSRAVHLGMREGEALHFNGIIDEVQIYNRALSASEVLASFDAIPVLPPLPPGLYFTDISSTAGIDNSVDGGHGVMFAEVDNDSLPDLYLTNNFENQGARDEFFFDNTNGVVFSEVATARGIEDRDGGSHGAVWADFDNDGDYDLFNGSTWGESPNTLGNPINDNLYRNDGLASGSFTEVTPAAIQTTLIETRGVTAFDMDGDGDLDLYGVSSAVTSGVTEAFRNDGNFAFSAYVGGALGTTVAMQGVTDTDYDGDGDIDIFAANRTGDVTILQNDGLGIFTQILPASLGITHEARDGITTGDLDNDGDLDLLLVSDGRGRLYLRNSNTGLYVFQRTFNAIEGYMGGFADLDNDGDLDLAFAGDERTFLNQGDGTFIAGQSMPVSEIDDPRAIAFADIEGDGDLDFAVAAKRSRNWLIRNDFDAAGNWLKVALVSPQCQAGAFGAKTRVYLAGQAGVSSAQIGMRESRGNYGYLAQDDPVLHFGLGAEASVDVVVDFLVGPTDPPATVTVSGVLANQRILINECPPPPP